VLGAANLIIAWGALVDTVVLLALVKFALVETVNLPRMSGASTKDVGVSVALNASCFAVSKTSDYFSYGCCRGDPGSCT